MLVSARCVEQAIPPLTGVGSPTYLAGRTVPVVLVNHTQSQKGKKLPTDQGGRTRVYPDGLSP
jgi:hypothetical protein